MSKARDLANVVVPSGAVVGTSDSQTLTNKIITGLVADGAITEEVYVLSGTAIDPANGTIQTKTLTENTTFTDSLSNGQTVVLMLNGGETYVVTFPTMTWVTSLGNAAPTLTESSTLVIWKIDTTLYGALVGSYV